MQKSETTNFFLTDCSTVLIVNYLLANNNNEKMKYTLIILHHFFLQVNVTDIYTCIL